MQWQFFGAPKCPAKNLKKVMLSVGSFTDTRLHVEPGVLRCGNYTRSRELQCNDYCMQRISGIEVGG